MSADQQLEDAYIERFTKERAFFNLLTKAIKDAVDEFELCDTSGSPEVEESVQLSITRLNDVVSKLKEEIVLNKEAAGDITNYFTTLAQENGLVQGSTLATASTPERSFANRAKGWFGFRPSPALPPPALPPPALPSPALPPPALPSPALPPPPPQSRFNRILGRFGKSDPLWDTVAKNPDEIYRNPIYQATPYTESEQSNPYNGKGGTRKRRSKKSRRRV